LRQIKQTAQPKVRAIGHASCGLIIFIAVTVTKAPQGFNNLNNKKENDIKK